MTTAINADLLARLDTLALEVMKIRTLVMNDALQSSGEAYPDVACKLFPAIVQLVGQRMNVLAQDIIGPRRTAAIASARHVAVWICYQVPRSTCFEVGVFFRRDYSTASNSLRVIGDERMLNTPLGRTADALLAEAVQLLKFEPKGF